MSRSGSSGAFWRRGVFSVACLLLPALVHAQTAAQDHPAQYSAADIAAGQRVYVTPQRLQVFLDE